MTDIWLTTGKYVFLTFLYVFLFWAIRGMAAQARTGAPSGGKPCLIIESGTGEPLTIPLRRMTAIGRSSDNDVVIDDSAVSGHHARILQRDHAWVIEDLGSSNGTFLNGSRFSDAKRLQNGDRVKVGRTTITVDLKDML